MRDTFGFQTDDLVRDRLTGTLGIICLGHRDPDDREGAAADIVDWQGEPVPGDLADERHGLDLLARDGKAVFGLAVVDGRVQALPGYGVVATGDDEPQAFRAHPVIRDELHDALAGRTEDDERQASAHSWWRMMNSARTEFRVESPEDEPDPEPRTTATMTALVGGVLAGRYPADGRWSREVREIDLVPGELCALEIKTAAGQVFRVEVTETADSSPVGDRVSLRRDRQ